VEDGVVITVHLRNGETRRVDAVSAAVEQHGLASLRLAGVGGGWSEWLVCRDADGVFLVDGPARLNGGSSTPILYENVGRSCDVPELHYVIPIERVPWDEAASHRAALGDYVERTESRPQLVPKYPSGLRAYDNWIRALESGTFDQFGLRYNTAVLADAKKYAAAYLEHLAVDGLALPHLSDVGGAARENAAIFGRMLDLLWPAGASPSAYLGQPVAPTQAKALVPLLREARAVEARQLDLTKRALAG
jgi:hypothetical protein